MSYKRMYDETEVFCGVLEFPGGTVRLGPHKSAHAANVAMSLWLRYNRMKAQLIERYVEVAEITWKRVEG